MQENKFQVEKVIDINRQDLDKVSNIKLDLQLLVNRRRNRHQKVGPENKPPVPAPAKMAVKVSSIKARATLRPIQDI